MSSDHHSDCEICQRIARMQTHPGFVAELQTGYVLLAKGQFFRGFAYFYSRIHAAELHELEPAFRSTYLMEMSLVAEAIFKAFHPRKMNYLLQGNSQPHLHWFLIPRHVDDPNPTGPIFDIDRAIWRSADSIPSSEERERIRTDLLRMLETLAADQIRSSFQH